MQDLTGVLFQWGQENMHIHWRMPAEERTKKKRDPKQQYYKSTATLKIFQQLTSFKMHTQLCYNTKPLQ